MEKTIFDSLAQAQESFDSLKSENDAAQTLLAEATTAAAESATKIATLESESATLKAELETVKAESATHLAKVEAVTAELDTLKTELKTVEAKAAQMASEVGIAPVQAPMSSQPKEATRAEFDAMPLKDRIAFFKSGGKIKS